MVLQKSYSAQGGLTKTNSGSSFQRSKSYGTPQSKPKPKPAPISPTTKGKLRKFNFEPATEEDENEDASTEPRTAAAAATPTPKTRLDWRDLIEPRGQPSVERRHHVEESPSERITWDSALNAGHAGVPQMMLLPPRANRKRARSSSPVSSPARGGDAGLKTPTVNIRKLAQAARTPHADPTLELWDRFSVPAESGNGKGKGGGKGAEPLAGAVNPALAGLMMASPRPHKDGLLGGGSGGLRRTMSCGGSLGSKRRRVNMSRFDSLPELDRRTPEVGGSPKTSLVTALLGTVGDSMQDGSPAPRRGRAAEDLPLLSSSSPTRWRGQGQGQGQTSRGAPPRGLSQQSGASQATSQRQAALPALPEAPESESDLQPEPKPAPESVSLPAAAGVILALDDFDDDDFDDEAMMQLEATITKLTQRAPAPPNATTATQAPAAPAAPAAAVTSASTSTSTSALGPSAASAAPVVDEFGDFDDDIFDEAEELMASLEPRSMLNTQATGFAVPAKAATATASANAGANASANVKAPKLLKSARLLEDTFDDDFGDDIDLDAVEMAAMAATQSVARTRMAIPTSQKYKPKAIQRYLVTDVLESEYEGSRGQALEKILVVKADSSSSNNNNAIKTIHLRDDWFDTPAHADAYVHVIGEFVDNSCVVDDGHNMVILHPDQLLSATVIADSFSCTRRSVLQDRVKATTEASAPLVYGTMLHEIFQTALLENRWDRLFLASVIDRTVEGHVEDLYSIKVGLHVAKEHLQSKMTELAHWAEAFVAVAPRSEAIVNDRGGVKANMSVSKLLDVEEHVWSPLYGLKGNIDATVQVTMRESDGGTRTLTVPFEVKTGGGRNVNSSHMAQTALYSLLISDRYDIEIAYGVLYYMETSQTHRIPAIRHELRHMIMQRNRLAVDVMERSTRLPPMKRSKNACGGCYAKVPCFIYHKLADGGDGETSGVGAAKFDEVVGHLTEVHRDFFLRWEDLLTQEEKESQKFRRELWTMVGAEREKKGRCFSDVVLEPGGSAGMDHGGGGGATPSASSRINKFKYTFVKRKPAPGFSFVESQLGVGEPVVVSDEQGHFALALGYVTAVRRKCISVAVDRRLHNARVRQPGFDEDDNQVFASIMDVAAKKGQQQQQDQEEEDHHEPVRYRLDKDEFSNGMATVRNNLVQVMADGVAGSGEIRRRVVDLAPPRFKAAPSQYALGPSQQRNQDSLNVDQRRAIDKVMSAQDYALVLGMPGTGKTTTIAHIIRALVSQGKSVLLTSYTHTAVDNILLKLRDGKMDMVRLGAAAKVHPDVHSFATVASRQRFTTFDQVRAAWLDTPVVATTCLGVGHALFAERTFDVCIVDEASQITLPVCLGPIRLARTFVLVGDHNQLPPLVRSDAARQGGLDVSLFKLLSDAHPESVVNLEHQYRMCEDIMTLSSVLIYNGRLRCGTEELRGKKLDVPNLDALRRVHHHSHSHSHHHCTTPSTSSCWLRALLDPSTRASFVNTDTLIPRVREEAKGNLIINPSEARIVAQLVDALVLCGVPESSIGVMTHYRSQLSLLRHSLRARAAVELDTADRFQGRDKDVVVLSLVRSNDACAIGDLLRDWRRINVAFTRARTKLLVVGSRETLRGCGDDEMLSRFVRLMEDRGWVCDLPAGAVEAHVFEEAATQLTASPARSAAVVREDIYGGVDEDHDKENEQTKSGGVARKRGKMGERTLLRGKPVLRDILNEMTDGAF